MQQSPIISVLHVRNNFIRQRVTVKSRDRILILFIHLLLMYSEWRYCLWLAPCLLVRPWWPSCKHRKSRKTSHFVHRSQWEMQPESGGQGIKHCHRCAYGKYSTTNPHKLRACNGARM